MFPVLRKLILKGEKEYLEQILARITAPSLDSVYIGFLGSTIFDISRISQRIGRTETFGVFDQACMLFDDVYSLVILSSRKGATGSKMLRLSLLSIESAWKLQELTLDSRDYFFEPFDLCKFEGSLPPSWANVMGNAPWLYLVRFFTATEYIYLSQGVAGHVAPALQELTGEVVINVVTTTRSTKHFRTTSRGIGTCPGGHWTVCCCTTAALWPLHRCSMLGKGRERINRPGHR
jgi:hypothetical protein